MSGKLDAKKLSEVEQILAKSEQGLSAEEILQSLKLSISIRTLQRGLAKLISEGVLETVGVGRATKYQLPMPVWSSQSAQIKHYLQQSFQERKTASYQRDFLFNYIPNETQYLPDTVRKHLTKLGTQFNQPQPAGTFAKKILDRLLIDLSWNSSRLEGNTYSLLETQRLVELGEEAVGKNLFEARMILNHKATIEFLLELGDDLEFNKYIVLNIHALLANNLLGDPGAPGRLREAPVGIGRTLYQPLAIPQLILECFERVLQTANKIDNPYEQSFFVMVHLPYLQPFIDVNKRVSRMSANIPLIKNNLCPLSFVGVTKQDYIDGILGVYELNQVDLLRDVYIAAYSQSAKRYNEAQAVLGEPDVFREQYHQKIITTIQTIVNQYFSKTQAINYINTLVEQELEQDVREPFVEIIHSELMGLHIGNIARYKIKPEVFFKWQQSWQN